MLPPSEFDNKFNEKFAVCGNATIDEKTDIAIQIVNECVREKVKNAIANYRDEIDGQMIAGPSLSQQVAGAICDTLRPDYDSPTE